MTTLLLDLPRFVLRDFAESDRVSFIAYQSDPRYLALYDLDATDTARAQHLFDRFLGWQTKEPRTEIQLGIFERHSGRLCGCAGLREITDDGAVFGIELTPDQWGRFALAFDVTTALLCYGFDVLKLDKIGGTTSSDNIRVARLARWFGACTTEEREGPTWMRVREAHEVDWMINVNRWRAAVATARGRQRLIASGQSDPERPGP